MIFQLYIHQNYRLITRIVWKVLIFYIIISIKEFSRIGNGWCRPDDCDVTDDECRVNGYYKDESNSDECKEACISHIPSCTGYAISGQSYKYPNRCYIYGNINPGQWQWQSDNGWEQMEWTDPASHFVPSLTQTIEREGLACFRRNVVSGTVQILIIRLLEQFI